MAQIELRHATIRIRDGFTATAAVNNVAGYAIGAVTMLMDLATATIPALASFTLAGHGETYIVTSTNGSTTITFSPALVASIADDAVINFGGRTLEVKIGTGNVTYNEQRKIDYTLNRGTLDTAREGDDIPMDVVMDFVWEFITAVTGSGTPTIEDALKQRGEASAWVTSSSDPCEPYAVDVIIQHTPPCGGQQVETTIFPDFRWESLNHNLSSAQVAVTGKCNAKQAIVSRAAA